MEKKQNAGRRHIHRHVLVGMLFLLTALMGLHVSAKTIVEKRNMFMFGGRKVENIGIRLFSAGFHDVTNVKSSNNKIATATLTKTGDGIIVRFKKKPGKVTVSFKGKHFRYGSCTAKYIYTIAKYKNPFAVLKFGDQDLRGLFQTRTSGKAVLDGVTGVLDIVLEKGWQLKEISYLPDDGEDTMWKSAGNHEQISFTGTGGEIDIRLRNTKLKEDVTFSISQ